MKYRKLGQSDLQLSVVTFGAWAAGGMMWGGIEKNDSVNAIRAAIDSGVTTIDTAPVYGMGYSEQLVGEAIKGLQRDKIQILTKFGLSWNDTKGEYFFDSVSNDGKKVNIYKYSGKESIIRECETSLKLLETDYIDLYQIHWADPTTPISETMEAVSKLIEQGKIRYAGVCNYTAEQIEEAGKYVKIISDQVPYSMVKRDIEKELIPYCINKNIGILAYSPLQRGLLTGKMKPGQTFDINDSRNGQLWFKDENIKKINTFLEKIKPLAEAKNATIGQLVISWTLEQPGLTIALVGARDVPQAIENAAAADISLSKVEVAFISRELSLL